MKTLKWLVLSTNKEGFGPCPKEVVMRPAVAFKELLEKRTNGSLQVELIKDFGSYKEQYGKRVDFSNIFEALQDNDVSIAQVEVASLEGPHRALDLPWMFESHEHATKVLDGSIGTNLNKHLEKKGMVGLAYTYSGGYRAFGSFDKIPSIEDFKGKKVLINGNPITKEYMEMLGLKTTREKRNGSIDFRDTTYIRFKEGKSFLKSSHSLFLTDIIVSKKFYDTLTTEEQDTLNSVAKEVATLERGWTTEDARVFEETAKERGCEIVQLSEEDKAMMKEKAESKYKEWGDKFFPSLNLVKKIKSLN
jgi:TRAP-type C4-dicarboxylate transport system substrate-binding protein|tara:strand:- start:105 stop:1019 length:915 start_codon:yes stop_codon:yes gene_type:complete